MGAIFALIVLAIGAKIFSHWIVTINLRSNSKKEMEEAANNYKNTMNRINAEQKKLNEWKEQYKK